MNIIKVRLEKRGYPVYVGAALEKLGEALAPHKPSRIFIVTNTLVFRLHGQRLIQGLKKIKQDPIFTMVPDGEQYKTLEQTALLYRACLKAGLDRNSMIIGFGGGVIGDMAGFAGATYMRGIPVVHVPTTLLAMVDSSIGGKTGVDLPEGKNLVGSFYQPQMVWIDISVLKTLPLEQWRNGMAEVIKYGVIADKKFFVFLETELSRHAGSSALKKIIIEKIHRYPFNFSTESLEEIILRSGTIKGRVVERDEKEQKGVREILNFGHTFGHALEASTRYREYLHGEAVAVGMVMASRLAEKMGIFRERKRIEAILANVQLPVRPKHQPDPEELLSFMKKDKKTHKGVIRFVLPVGIGKVKVFSDVKEKAVKDVINESGRNA